MPNDAEMGTRRRPDDLHDIDHRRIRDLDVRQQLREGKEPFERIMAAGGDISERDVLRVRATFEPEPLYSVMASRGFDHWTEKLEEDDWRVWFWRSGASADR